MGAVTSPAKALLLVRLVVRSVIFLVSNSLVRPLRLRLVALTTKPKPKPSSSPPDAGSDPAPNVVIVGASFAGYQTAHILARSLPRSSPCRIVVVEPNSHFNFTWVLPRFSVVPDHEHKAFIPYGPHVAPSGAQQRKKLSEDDRVTWMRDRVVEVRVSEDEDEAGGGKNGGTVILASGRTVEWKFLVVATGSYVDYGLPSRVGSDDKREGIELLRAMQERVRKATRVVVAGGGAAGVEFATDVKGLYPDKSVTLVHSRDAVMHRFGPELQAVALEALGSLGVDVVLSQRVIDANADGGSITLSSGQRLPTDCFINCTGQKPTSGLLSPLTKLDPSGHIPILPTLQVSDPRLPNVYACGDVAATGVRNPNSRSAFMQAGVVAENIALAVMGAKPEAKYVPHWGEGFIKLTLGLDRSVSYFGDGKTELLFHSKETDLALMCDGMWRTIGVEPFKDDDSPEPSASETSAKV